MRASARRRARCRRRPKASRVRARSNGTDAGRERERGGNGRLESSSTMTRHRARQGPRPGWRSGPPPLQPGETTGVIGPALGGRRPRRIRSHGTMQAPQARFLFHMLRYPRRLEIQGSPGARWGGSDTGSYGAGKGSLMTAGEGGAGRTQGRGRSTSGRCEGTSVPGRGRIALTQTREHQPPRECWPYASLGPEYENVHRGQSSASDAMTRASRVYGTTRAVSFGAPGRPIALFPETPRGRQRGSCTRLSPSSAEDNVVTR